MTDWNSIIGQGRYSILTRRANDEHPALTETPTYAQPVDSEVEHCIYTFYGKESGEHLYAQPQCEPIELEPFNVGDEPYCRYCGKSIVVEERGHDEDE